MSANDPFPFTWAVRKAQSGSVTEGEVALSSVSGLSVRVYPPVQVWSESWRIGWGTDSPVPLQPRIEWS
jgi:hypothetical protein